MHCRILNMANVIKCKKKRNNYPDYSIDVRTVLAHDLLDFEVNFGHFLQNLLHVYNFSGDAHIRRSSQVRETSNSLKDGELTLGEVRMKNAPWNKLLPVNKSVGSNASFVPGLNGLCTVEYTQIDNLRKPNFRWPRSSGSIRREFPSRWDSPFRTTSTAQSGIIETTPVISDNFTLIISRHKAPPPFPYSPPDRIQQPRL